MFMTAGGVEVGDFPEENIRFFANFSQRAGGRTKKFAKLRAA
jgi:hypothetical protein